jgi:hypothetical protein
MNEFKNQSRFSKAGMFIVGFFSGLLGAALVLVLLAGYVLKHPQAILIKAGDFGIKHVVEKTVESAPKAYIGEKQDEIASTAQKMAKAFSENRISPADMQMLAARFMGMMADQNITKEEIDEVLRLMNQFTQQ